MDDIRWVEESGWYFVLIDDVVMFQSKDKEEVLEFIRRIGYGW